jgi:aflatoxin B1 aldehyde reductase
MSPPIKLIFGAHAVHDNSPDQRAEYLSILARHNIPDLDTARVYSSSEAALGALHPALANFTLHTKAIPASLSRDAIEAAMAESLRELRRESVDTYFLHAPDTRTEIGETLSAINGLHRSRKFRHFGLSNYAPSDVEAIHALAKKNGYVLPTVYEGNYNALARHAETDLLPLLRKLKLSFWAYSPLAGGFFAKDPDELEKGTSSGRFDAHSFGGKMYNSLYTRPSLVAALREWGRIADDAGISTTELALRWVAFHSGLDAARGDAVIVGASRPAQLEESLEMVERGPLSRETAERAGKVWEGAKDEAPVDNWSSFMEGAMGLAAGAKKSGTVKKEEAVEAAMDV